MDGALWVELSGDLIIARLRGEPTVELLAECQERVMLLARDAGRARVLYDVLEMMPPPVDVPWSQRALDESWATCTCAAPSSCPPPNSHISPGSPLARATIVCSTTTSPRP